MGPKFFLPHMLPTVGRNAAGKYCCCVMASSVHPWPQTFGSDKYVATLYGYYVLAWYENAMTIPASVNLPPSKSFTARRLRSRVHVAVGDLSLDDDDTEISTKHVQRRLHWISEGKESEARQRGGARRRRQAQEVCVQERYQRVH